MVVFERDIAVDMGTTTTLLFEEGKGIVAREPTVLAVDRVRGEIKKVGTDAQKVLGRAPANIAALHPISAGVISDYEMAAQMLKELISRVTTVSLFKPRVLVCVPSSISSVEERAMIDACIEAGGRRVYMVETSLATALGAGVDIGKANGHMVLDIGGGTTEVAVVANGGVVSCDSIKVAGQSFDEAIVRYIRKKYNMLIGLTAAEELKRSIGCVMQRPDMGVEELRGRSLTDAKPKVIQVSANELIEAFVDPMNRILEAVHEVRIQKVTNRMRFLKERYGFHFSESEIASLMKHRNPGKPHIAKLMVRHRYAGTISEAILGFIDHYHGPERRIHPEEAIEAVIQGGGIPVLAHGPFGDGEQNLDKKEMTARVERLMNAGLMGLECYYSGFAEVHQDMMLELASRYHLLVTAGSDYHGENKLVRLGNTGRSDPAEINERIRDFWVEAMKRGDSYSLN